MFRMGQKEIDAVARVIKSKELFRIGSKNHEVDNFEMELAEKVGVNYALFVTGGTTALIAGLIGLGIGPGDEVIVPAYTFMASALAVTAVGAIPVIAEVDETLGLDPKDVELKISPHTKAIMPVHMLGLPCDMDRIMDIADKHGLYVIEDACQAVGGSYKGKRLGSIGHVGAYSFNYYKIISCGEGGALLTNDRVIFERAVYQHDGGSTFRSDYVELNRDKYEDKDTNSLYPIYDEYKTPVFAGMQYRQSEINGAIMRVQLERLDGILADLRRNKSQIIDGLNAVSNLHLLKSNDPHGDCGTHLGFTFKDEKTARQFAASEGVNGSLPIDSGRHVYTNWAPIMNKRGASHPAMNPFEMPANQGLNFNYSMDMCPVTLDLLRRTVFIPINPDWTHEEVQNKIDKIVLAAENL
jgi:dTDP-4-amino-4,6-dideoxygalactose transaminase